MTFLGRIAVTCIGAASLAVSARAQQPGVREQLLTRGAPAEFAAQVAAIVAVAEAENLPTEPLVSKAFEGWAKRASVSPDRVVAVLNQIQGQLRIGRELALAAGLNPPPGTVVSAAAFSLSRGVNRQEVLDIIGAAPQAEAAATGLTVASALAAQGLDRAAAVRVVCDAFRGGRAPEEVLELPSALTGLRARGEPMSDIARRILDGGGIPLLMRQGAGPGGPGGRPPGVPGAQPGAQGSRKKKGQSGEP